MDKILNILKNLRDILEINNRSYLSEKLDHLIELRSNADPLFLEKFNSGYFWGQSYPQEYAPIWGVNCHQHMRDYLQAFIDLAQAMKEEGICNERAEIVAERSRRLLNGKK